MRRIKMQGNFDLYNLLNASTPLAANSRFGSQWLNVRQIMGGRLFKFGAQVDF